MVTAVNGQGSHMGVAGMTARQSCGRGSHVSMTVMGVAVTRRRQRARRSREHGSHMARHSRGIIVMLATLMGAAVPWRAQQHGSFRARSADTLGGEGGFSASFSSVTPVPSPEASPPARQPAPAAPLPRSLLSLEGRRGQPPARLLLCDSVSFAPAGGTRSHAPPRRPDSRREGWATSKVFFLRSPTSAPGVVAAPHSRGSAFTVLFTCQFE